MASWSPHDLSPAPPRSADPYRFSGATRRQAFADLLAQLENLAELRAEGYLTDEAFEAGKARLLARP
jgi:hypothetical protein